MNLRLGALCLVLASLFKSARAEEYIYSVTAADGTSCKWNLEIMYLQDVSGSVFAQLDDLKRQLPAILDLYSPLFVNPKFGVATFSDIPVPLVGCALPQYTDTCFDLKAALRGMTGESVRNGLDQITVTWGGDDLEAQLIALQHVATGNYFNQERFDAYGNPVLRLVVMNTNSFYHVIGDLTRILGKRAEVAEWCNDYPGCCPHGGDSSVYTILPNNNDAILTCDPTGTMFEEYPSEEEVIQLLIDKNIALIVLASDYYKQWMDFEEYSKQLGMGTVAVLTLEELYAEALKKKLPPILQNYFMENTPLCKIPQPEPPVVPTRPPVVPPKPPIDPTPEPPTCVPVPKWPGCSKCPPGFLPNPAYTGKWD